MGGIVVGLNSFFSTNISFQHEWSHPAYVLAPAHFFHHLHHLSPGWQKLSRFPHWLGSPGCLNRWSREAIRWALWRRDLGKVGISTIGTWQTHPMRIGGDKNMEVWYAWNSINVFLIIVVEMMYFFTYIIWVVPPPSNCGKWRFIGIPY